MKTPMACVRSGCLSNKAPDDKCALVCVYLYVMYLCMYIHIYAMHLTSSYFLTKGSLRFCKTKKVGYKKEAQWIGLLHELSTTSSSHKIMLLCRKDTVRIKTSRF
jgi:hypothetical protein